MQDLTQLRGIREDGDHVVIGAMTTYADVIASPLLRTHAALLVQAVEEVADPQIRHQRMRITVDHPKHGPIDVLGFPIKFTDEPCRIHRPPPDLGEDADTLLAELGYSAESIAALRRQRVTRPAVEILPHARRAHAQRQRPRTRRARRRRRKRPSLLCTNRCAKFTISSAPPVRRRSPPRN